MRDRRHDTRDRRPETGDVRQETGDMVALMRWRKDLRSGTRRSGAN